MANTRDTPPNRVVVALDALSDLTLKRLRDAVADGESAGVVAHGEIQVRPVSQKSSAFYRYLGPLQSRLIEILADSYRGYFKIALANPQESGNEPEQWAWSLLHPFVVETIDWIRDWYTLACDGENRYVRPVASTAFVPGQTVSLDVPLTMPPSPLPEAWRAPAWLFNVSPFTITWMKTKHVPATDTEDKLGAAHTRLLLKGARRLFLGALATAIDNVRNEEAAAAGAIPVETLKTNETARPKRAFKGIEGLGQKHADLSRYMHNLTEKQQLAFSLKYEYELGLTEIASRMGLDRKTAYEHIDAAKRKVEQTFSADKRQGNQFKSSPE